MPITVGDVQEALSMLGGRAHLTEIERVVREIATPPIPGSTPNIIRGRLQQFSSDAQSYGGGADLFHSVHGVKARQGIWELRADALSPGNQDLLLDGAEADVTAYEGQARLRKHLRRERSRRLVRQFKSQLDVPRCCVCEFDFSSVYGSIGDGFIEAHHTIPVSALEADQPTHISDLVAVCSNCHRMLHRNGLMDWRELRQILNERIHSRQKGEAQKL